MGVFKPFIGGVRTVEEDRVIDHSNDHAFTPADVLTVARPQLAGVAAWMLLTGRRPASPVAILAGLTDMEGIPARFIDKHWPGSGWGTTEHGARWDTYADTAALLMIGSAAMMGPRVSAAGKAAMGTVLGQEGFKTGWALLQNHRYQELGGERLALPPSLAGKEAMAEKLAAAVLAVATNDFDDPRIRAGLGAGALVFAGTGALRGEMARRAYQPLVDEMMREQLESWVYEILHEPDPSSQEFFLPPGIA